eukprot:528916_1
MSFEITRKELEKRACTIVVFGASGHLAKTKTYPSLFDVFCEKMLPNDFQCIGYGRSKLNHKSFHDRISLKLKGSNVNEFLSHCSYFRGTGYGDETSLRKLGKYIDSKENAKYNGNANRLFYLAVPPEVFGEICHGIKLYLSKDINGINGWTRIIVEKPFGMDTNSCNKLLSSMSKYFPENSIYRVDHYLAKEMIQNIISFRFSNIIFDNIWNNKYIKCIKISMKETGGVDGRGGYYDQNGVIRDILQNHLLQVLTLITMERPNDLSATQIRNEKVKVLQCMDSINHKLTITGQYKGYRQDKTTDNNSNQITFIQSIFFVNNYRWNGVPIICKCGKGLDDKKVEISIQFNNNNGLNKIFNGIKSNELIIRIQPNPCVYFKINNKIPGYKRFDKTNSYKLELNYKQFDKIKLPAAYTRLIMDCLRGDQSLFVRADELIESWRIVTPYLNKLQTESKTPMFYPFGSRGPIQADKMAQQYGFQIDEQDKYKQLKSKL